MEKPGNNRKSFSLRVNRSTCCTERDSARAGTARGTRRPGDTSHAPWESQAPRTHDVIPYVEASGRRRRMVTAEARLPRPGGWQELGHAVRCWCPRRARVRHQDGGLKCVHFLRQIHLREVVDILKESTRGPHAARGVCPHRGSATPDGEPPAPGRPCGAGGARRALPGPRVSTTQARPPPLPEKGGVAGRGCRDRGSVAGARVLAGRARSSAPAPRGAHAAGWRRGQRTCQGLHRSHAAGRPHAGGGPGHVSARPRPLASSGPPRKSIKGFRGCARSGRGAGLALGRGLCARVRSASGPVSWVTLRPRTAPQC